MQNELFLGQPFCYSLTQFASNRDIPRLVNESLRKQAKESTRAWVNRKMAF